MGQIERREKTEKEIYYVIFLFFIILLFSYMVLDMKKTGKDMKSLSLSSVVD